MKKTFLSILILSLITQITFSFSDEPPLELSLESAIDLAIQSNLELTVQRLQPQITSFEIQKNWGVFDPQLLLSARYTDSENPLTHQYSIAAGGLTRTELEKTSFTSALDGKLPTGTQYKLEFDSARDSGTFNQFDPEYSQALTTTLTQPLLKNRGTENNLAFIRISKNQVAVAQWQLKQSLMNVVAQVEMVYWDLVLALEDLKVKEESLKLAKQLLEQNRIKAKIGTLTQLEVTQAEAGTASRESALLDTQQQVTNERNRLKKLIFPDAAKKRGIQIIPIDKPQPQLQETPTPERIQWGLENRPELQTAKLNLLNQNIFLKYYSNQTLPRVDLEGTLGLNGLGGGFGGSVDEIIETDHPMWGAGIIFRYPLGHRADTANYRQSALQVKASLLEIKRIENDIVLEIDTAAAQLETSWKKIQAATSLQRLATEALRAEQKKYEAGTSTSHQVLEFEEDVAIAKSNKLKAKIDYLKNLATLNLLQGTTLSFKNITVEEE